MKESTKRAMSPRIATRSPSRSASLVVHAFDETAGLAKRLARALNARASLILEHRFPDRECLVRVAHRNDAEAIVVQSFNEPDGKLLPALLAADALHRAGARRVTLVAPYLAYMRQDRVFRPGESVSQTVFGECLGRWFDRVFTVEAHLHRIRRLSEATKCRGRSLSAAPVVAQWLARQAPDALVVGPDEESQTLVESIARVAGVRWAAGIKTRIDDRRVRIRFPDLPAGDRAVIVDDIASSGATIAAAAGALRARGVRTLDAVVVHAIFARGALELMRRAGVRRIVSCDTIPHPTNRISCAPLIAAALESSL